MSWTCFNCNSTVLNTKYCFNCDYCKSCCICNTPKFFNSKLQFHTPTRSQKRNNKTSRYISAEIEVARLGSNKKLVEDVVKKWGGSIVYDGTLPEGGFEINTAPAGGDLYVKQVTEICNKLAKAGALISDHCGLHVHLDARDFNYSDIGRLIKVYAAIEPTLFSMVPACRRNSKYSIKCGDKLENAVKANNLPHIQLKEKIITAIYGEPNSISHRGDKRGAGHGTGRYYALNLHSWLYRGTIECRLFDGTIDKNEIVDWGVLWAKILDFALNSSDDEVSKAMKKENSYDSLTHIIKDDEELRAFTDARFAVYGSKSKSILSEKRVKELWKAGFFDQYIQ